MYKTGEEQHSVEIKTFYLVTWSGLREKHIFFGTDFVEKRIEIWNCNNNAHTEFKKIELLFSLGEKISVFAIN